MRDARRHRVAMTSDGGGDLSYIACCPAFGVDIALQAWINGDALLMRNMLEVSELSGEQIGNRAVPVECRLWRRWHGNRFH